MTNPNTRLNASDVATLIASTTFHRSPSGKAIICEIMTTSGHSCVGVARVIDMDNDDEERGKEAARGHAMNEVFAYASVMMQQAMSNGVIQNRNKELLAEYAVKHANQPRII